MKSAPSAIRAAVSMPNHMLMFAFSRTPAACGRLPRRPVRIVLPSRLPRVARAVIRRADLPRLRRASHDARRHFAPLIYRPHFAGAFHHHLRVNVRPTRLLRAASALMSPPAAA